MSNETKGYDKETYTNIKKENLILLGIYRVLRNNETCTFERLVAECFSNFPKVFGFGRYPQWPDSLKFDRVLRTLRQKGLIVGGAGGTYSPGEFSLTKFGEKMACETEKDLLGKGLLICQKRRNIATPRSIDEKLIVYLKKSPQFNKFMKDPKNFLISEPEFRNLLRCTLETPLRVLKQNLEYYKNLAESYNEKELLDFLSLCEIKFIKVSEKNG